MPFYSLKLLSVFEQEWNLSLYSCKLNNLFCFSVLGVTGGFHHLPAPSNVAIIGQVYNQIIDTIQGQHLIQWFLYNEGTRKSQAQQKNLPPALINSFKEFLELCN